MTWALPAVTRPLAPNAVKIHFMKAPISKTTAASSRNPTPCSDAFRKFSHRPSPHSRPPPGLLQDISKHQKYLDTIQYRL